MSKGNEQKKGKGFVRRLYEPFQKSLGWKIVVLLLVISVFITIISTAAVTVYQVNQRQQELESNVLLESEYVSQQLDILLKQYESHVNFLWSASGTRILLQNLNSSEFNSYQDQWSTSDLLNGSIYLKYIKSNANLTEKYSSLLNVIVKLVSSNVDIDSVRVFGPNGNLVIGSYDGEEVTHDYEGDTIWFKRAMDQSLIPSGAIQVSSVGTGSFSSVSVLRFYEPLDINGVRLGFVVIDFNLNVVSNVLRSSQSQLETLVIDLRYENSLGEVVGPVVIRSVRYPSMELDVTHTINELSQSIVTSGNGEIVMNLKGVQTTFFFHVNNYMLNRPLPRYILVGLEAPTKDLRPNYWPIIPILLIIFVVTTVFVLFVGRLASTVITRNINELREVSTGMSHGDLITPVDPKILEREDEIGEIGRLFEGVRLSLLDLLKPTKEATTMMSGYMEQLYLAASELDRSSGEISDSFKEIADGMNLQADRNNEVISLVSNHAELVTKALDQVTEILEVLRDTIEETTFIALNAQIEAARAGAMGRGFMVVASSIRELASKGKERLKEVNLAMNQIRINLEDSVRKIISNTEDLSTSTEEIAAISEESLSNLLDQVALLKEMSTLITRLNNMAKEIDNTINRFNIGEE